MQELLTKFVFGSKEKDRFVIFLDFGDAFNFCEVEIPSDPKDYEEFLGLLQKSACSFNLPAGAVGVVDVFSDPDVEPTSHVFNVEVVNSLKLTVGSPKGDGNAEMGPGGGPVPGTCMRMCEGEFLSGSCPDILTLEAVCDCDGQSNCTIKCVPIV